MKHSRRVTFAAWGLIALGVAMRLRQYLANRSLWLDEAMLALNILNKNVAGLFGKLDYEQGAPLGFLLLEKLAATLFGSGERALRLLPLLAGCAALILFYLLARQILAPAGMLTSLALFAFSPALIYYSSEVKQYSVDVLVALALLYLAWRPPRSTRFAQGILLAAGALSVWFSHPAIFVLAAIGILRLIENRQHPLKTLALGAAWLASFGILYLVNLRALSQDAFLLNYWGEYFSAGAFSSLLGVFENPAGIVALSPLLLALICALGAGLLFARQPKAAGTLALIFLIALAASVLRKYPFAGRMVLFAVPLLHLFFGAAVDGLKQFRLRSFFSTLLAAALAGTLLYAPALTSTRAFLTPKYPEHIRPALAYWQANRKPGDLLYVYNWAIPAFRYYTHSSADFIAGGLYPENPQALLSELDGLKGRGRVWILFAHVYENADYNEKDMMLEHLSQIGEKKRQFIEPGSSVYLYLYDLK